MKDGSASLVRAWEQSHSLMLREASRLRLGRRSSGLTGVHAARALLKVQEEQVYGSQGSPASRETLLADAIDEPACVSPVVNMLEALPAEDSLYYQDERNVIDATGKSAVLFAEIEAQYGFAAGSESEYVKYLRRPDLPRGMWRWATRESVRAIAGVSTVKKNTPGRQRKLLMQCAANYM